MRLGELAGAAILWVAIVSTRQPEAIPYLHGLAILYSVAAAITSAANNIMNRSGGGIMFLTAAAITASIGSIAIALIMCVSYILLTAARYRMKARKRREQAAAKYAKSAEIVRPHENS